MGGSIGVSIFPLLDLHILFVSHAFRCNIQNLRRPFHLHNNFPRFFSLCCSKAI